MKRRAFLGTIIRTGTAAGLAVHARAGRAAEGPPWKVGLARVKITPERALCLIGYRRRGQFEGVVSDLYAKALALEDSAGRRALLITTDLVGVQASVAKPICERIERKTRLKRGQILINSSHTHCGPLLSLDPSEISPPGKAVPSAEGWKATVAYTGQLRDKIGELAARAISRLEGGRLAWGTGEVGFVMNRRKPGPKGIWIGPNPKGVTDRTVPVLRVESPAGKLRAVVFGCACHTTAVPGKVNKICADYAGFAQAEIERHHPGVQAMFLMGCGADAAPHPAGSVKLARAHGDSLGQEVCRVLGTGLRPVRGPLRTALGYADLPLREFRSDAELQALGRQNWILGWVAAQLLAMRKRGDTPPTRYRAPIALWHLGRDVTLVALPGETVVDYVALVGKMLGPDRLWVAGYSNDLFGYLPSARVLAEGGGIETMGLYYGGAGVFTPKVQQVVLDKVAELAKRAAGARREQ